jgi:hypothetical protein
MFHSPRIRFQASLFHDPGSNPDPGPRSVVMTLVVRGKGDCDAFLGKFWESWRGRAWESEASGPARVEDSGAGSGFYTREGAVRMVGVSGILRKEQEMWESTDKSLQEAFQDLNALMVTCVFNVYGLCVCPDDFCFISMVLILIIIFKLNVKTQILKYKYFLKFIGYYG